MHFLERGTDRTFLVFSSVFFFECKSRSARGRR